MQVDSQSKYDNSPLLGNFNWTGAGYTVKKTAFGSSDMERKPTKEDIEKIKNYKGEDKDAILEFDVSSSEVVQDFAVVPYSESDFRNQAIWRKSSWVKMMEKEGYTVIQGERSLSDKHAYFDDEIVYHLRAVPNSLIEKQKEYVSNPHKNKMATLQKGVSEELYNQQMSRSTQDQGIVLNDASNKVSGGVFNQLIDYQQQDTNNSNTHRFYMNENGSYRMADDGMNAEEANLNLYEAREVVGTTTVDGKQIPLIRYALKDNLTESQIFNEISKSMNLKSQLGSLDADEKRDWNATSALGIYSDWKGKFATDVVVGTLGTSFALEEAVKNTKNTFESIAEYGDGAQTANALTQLAQTEISLDGNMQDRLALNYIDLYQGTIPEIRNQGTPFALSDGSMARYDIIYKSTGGGLVTQEITLVDAKRYPNETRGKEVLTQNLGNVMNSDVPAFMRSYELLYGVNANQAYINNLQNSGGGIDVAKVGR